MDLIITAIISATITAIFSMVWFKRSIKSKDDEISNQLMSSNQKDKEKHALEMSYLSRQKETELKHAEILAAERLASLNEGKEYARNDHALALGRALAEQKAEFMERIVREKERAADEAREKTRVEFELQAKLFSVKISPYAQILTDKGMVWDDYETKAGYQYQLLINGIPAFQPHIVVERHEKIKEVDPSVKQALIKTASQCAEAALKTYLGANLKFGELAPPILVETKS